MPSSALLRSFVNGIRACLGTRFRMVGLALVTAIRVSVVKCSGTPVSTTWQDLQKKSSSDCFFGIHLIWNRLRHFEHPTQKKLTERLQHLRAEQNLLFPLREFFIATNLWLQALHTTRVTMPIFGEEPEQPKTRMGTNKGNPLSQFQIIGISEAI